MFSFGLTVMHSLSHLLLSSSHRVLAQKLHPMSTKPQSQSDAAPFLTVTLPAPGDQGLWLAFCHALHHRRTAEHDGGVARRRHNHNSVRVCCRLYKKTRTDRQVFNH